jgi:hypothetical protein
MPKKAGSGNSKAVAAKAVKQIRQIEAKSAAEQAAEDARWADEGKPATKASLKKQAAEEAAADKAARKSEDRVLAAAEEEAISSTVKAGGGKKKGGGQGKMTQAMILQAKAMQKEREDKIRAKAEKAASGIVDESDYARMVSGANRNLEQSELNVTATGVEAALAAVGGDRARIQALAAAGGGQRDQNQAAKGTMTFKVFEASRLAEIKGEKPGLQGSQYRDMCKKEWKRSPMNPNNA